MNVLVAYFSQTGNTEKIARAIFEEASRGNHAELKKLEEVGPGDLAPCDFVFLGSPLHAGNIAGPAKDFLSQVEGGSVKTLAGFITHAAPAYPAQDMDRYSEPIQEACRRNGIEYKGCFGCQGFLTEALHEMIQKSRKMTDAQWAETVKQMTGHPDAEDLEKARAFARKSLA